MPFLLQKNKCSSLLLRQRIFFEKPTGDVTLLPLMPLFKWFPACGVVSSATLGGKDIVVAGGNDANTVLIYNTETNAWRPGPFLPREIESVSAVQFVRSNIITSSSLRKKIIEYHFWYAKRVRRKKFSCSKSPLNAQTLQLLKFRDTL